MLKYYVDDCEFGGTFQHTVLYGGIIIKAEDELSLIREIEDYKYDFCGRRYAPVKSNLKDLKKYYLKHEQAEAYDKLITDYNNFRKGLLEVISKYDYKILTSCIKSFFPRKEFIISSKENLRKFAFNMCLMRFALEANENKVRKNTLVMDYPSGKNSNPYNIEYLFAYNKGTTSNSVKYKSGKLSDNNFLDSVYYTCSKTSSLLQVADIILGATKQFIEFTIDRKSGEFGYNLIKDNLSKFRGYPDHVATYGFVMDNGEGTRDLKSAVGRELKEILK